MALSEVSNILWRERQLLELLVFKLEEEQLVLASGRTRWLSYATREVETILGEIKRVELERAMAVAGAIGELGLSDSPSLRELAAIAPTPWDGIFVEHRRALLTLAQEIEAITKSNRELLQRGHQAAAKRSRRSATSTSTWTRTTPAARCPTARSRCDWSTRRFDEGRLSERRLARRDRSRPERGGNAAVRHRARRRRREHGLGHRRGLVGRGGAAALQTALQTAINTAIGVGNATATVTTNTDGSLSVSVTPTGTHALEVRASGTNAGFTTLLGNTPVGTDGIGGRAFFSGTDAATLALSALVANSPGAIAAVTRPTAHSTPASPSASATCRRLRPASTPRTTR